MVQRLCLFPLVKCLIGGGLVAERLGLEFCIAVPGEDLGRPIQNLERQFGFVQLQVRDCGIVRHLRSLPGLFHLRIAVSWPA